jgi:hypothetical protein
MSTFRDFLSEGRLGEIVGGVSEEFVRERLGEPEDISVQTNPTTWKYGPLQFAFLRGRTDAQPTLKSIHVACDSDEPLPQGVDVQGWWPTSETTPESFRSESEKVGMRVVHDVDSPPNKYLILATGDRITFVDGRLHSLDWTSRKEPQYKQVSLSIPKSELDVISKIASETKVSVSALCSKWISEHVSELCKAGSA